MSTAPLIYDLTKGEQQELYQLFDDQRLKQYFQPSKHSGMNGSISAYYTQERTLHIDQLIQQGAVEVAQHRGNLDQYLEPTRVSKEEQLTFDLRAKREQIERQLNYLRLQIGQPPRSPNSISNLSPMQQIKVLSKAEHSSIVGKLLREKNERQRRHSQLLQQTIMREEEEERERRLNKQRMQSEEKQQKRLSIEKSIHEQKQKHEQFLKREKESAIKCQEIKQHRFLHQQIEERYEREVLLPNLQEKKKQLKNLREMKALNMDDLHKHEKQYLQRKQQSVSRKDTIVPKYHYEAPARSNRLEGILEDERMSRILKLEEKKKRIDEKLSRQENFVAYLQEKFIPKIDPAKRQEIEQRMKKSAQGKLESRDHRMLGIGYLEESKRKRKAMVVPRPQSENATVSVDSKDISSRAMTNYLSEIREKDVNYEGRRRRQLARLINAEEVSPQEKISRLQRESEKLSEHMGRHQKILKYQKDEKVQKQALEMLLSNIQAKMGIIEMDLITSHLHRLLTGPSMMAILLLLSVVRVFPILEVWNGGIPYDSFIIIIIITSLVNLLTRLASLDPIASNTTQESFHVSICKPKAVLLVSPSVLTFFSIWVPLQVTLFLFLLLLTPLIARSTSTLMDSKGASKKVSPSRKPCSFYSIYTVPVHTQTGLPILPLPPHSILLEALH